MQSFPQPAFEHGMSVCCPCLVVSGVTGVSMNTCLFITSVCTYTWHFVMIASCTVSKVFSLRFVHVMSLILHVVHTTIIVLAIWFMELKVVSISIFTK